MCYIVFTEKHFRQCFVDMKIKTKTRERAFKIFWGVVAYFRKIVDFLLLKVGEV